VKESECPHHQAGLPSIPCVQVGPEQPSLSLQVCAVRILQAQSLPGLQRLVSVIHQVLLYAKGV
jgi:hypothetical protein